MQAEGIINGLTLLDGLTSALVHCPDGLIPAPGQYVLAHADGSDAPLATVLFAARTQPGGFLAAAPIPSTWGVGTRLHLRGPLGHGFRLPPTARRIALVAFRCSALTVLSLLEPALGQDASLTLAGENAPDELPLQVEVQPLSALPEICKWADFIAFDISRELLPELRGVLQPIRLTMKAEAQILVRTPMPCGALAACGVCTVDGGEGALLACEDGPVFELNQVIGWSRRA